MIYQSEIKVPDVEQKILALGDERPKIIFGTGSYGALALHALRKLGIQVSCFCDSNETNWGTEFYGYKVISPSELVGKYSEGVVLTASLRYWFMMEKLKENSRLQALTCDFLFSALDLSDIEVSVSIERLIWMLDLYMFAVNADNDKTKIKIKSLDVVVTEKCSLRCRDCSNLMQYYDKPRDNDIELMTLSISRFMENVDELHEARLIGGEPLMFKQLPIVIRQLCNYTKCRKITIFTNGTILPKGEMLESLKNDKVSLIISDYGGLSKNSNALTELLLRMDLPFITYKADCWQDCAKIYYRERTSEQLQNVFGDCCVNDAVTLLHGKLYSCPFSAHAINLNAIPDEFCDDEISLFKLNDAELSEKLRELKSQRKYIKTCAYCAGRDYSVGKIQAAIQSAAPIALKKYIRNSSSNQP